MAGVYRESPPVQRIRRSEAPEVGDLNVLRPGPGGLRHGPLVMIAKRTWTITNSASVTSDVADPVSGNNAATESTTVVR